MRNRTTSASNLGQRTAYFAPGQLVREMGRRCGWELGLCNVMLEGTTDVAYFELANILYEKMEKRRLMSDDFRMFAVGEGSEGGTESIKDKLRLLSEMLRIDPVDESGNKIRVICVFDDDTKGRGAFNAMKNKFRPWGDIFLLRRRFPRSTRDPNTFESVTSKLNAPYLADKNFFCEIEDLIARSLIDAFVDSNGGSLQKAIQTCGEGFHCDLHSWAKGNLVKFVRENALLEDVALLVDLLKSLRYLFGLPEDGTPIA